jgi:hypothetical protein
VKVDYTPHAAQYEIHRARRDYRFRTVCTGRRFGKTRCMAGELLYTGAVVEGGDYGWVAPTYGVTDRGVEAFREIAPELIRVVGRMPTRVEFDLGKGPCKVWFLSADNPDSIRGFGFKGLVVDEAASVPVEVWNYVLRPTLAQTMGWGVFIGTPAGRNWFYDMFTRGVKGSGEAGFKSFTFPSLASPYFPKDEWEAAKRELPEDVFKQEYMAEFLEDGAGVFRGVDGCLLGRCEDVDRGRYRRVVVGCDIAKHTDWTVLIAADMDTGECLAMDRFNNLDWPFQKDRIREFVRKWDALLVMDATGVGDPIYDDLCEDAALRQVLPVRFTPKTKTALVHGLMVAIEQKKVRWPKDESGSALKMRNRVDAAGGCAKLPGMARKLRLSGPSNQGALPRRSGLGGTCAPRRFGGGALVTAKRRAAPIPLCCRFRLTSLR